MSEYPVQITKVQAPPVRDDTLARPRLLDWLGVKVHRRVVLLTAEAGYGKTTLLADFTRRSRVRVLWFRLDAGDRDWVGFLAYLVASIRLHLPGFGPGTWSLLRETATAVPQRDAVMDTFLRELGDLPPDATALVLDDFHLVDDAPDVRFVVRELLRRAPERLTLVFASRREPPIRLARLRALGEVAELFTDDLRFDAAETEQLFRETYELRLEPGLLAELTRRTEGWAASLQLVRTAIHDRDPAQVRAFISSLSGAEGHLYDYLAEEVVGDLAPELQAFLMRTSVLDTINLALGPVAAEVPVDEAARWIDEGERLGLLGKGGPHTRHVARAHPLVRDFLQARLERSVGPERVREIHHRVAVAAESIDWQIAARHYLAAAEPLDAERVLVGALEAILATGAYSTAQALAAGLPTGELPGAPGLVIASRLAQQRASTADGRDLAERAWAADPTSTAVLLNLVTARSLAGDVAGALEAGHLLEQSPRPQLAEIGRAYRLTVEASTSGSLVIAAETLGRMAESHRVANESHFLGVALCNRAQVLLPMGLADEALASAEEAIEILRQSSSGVELISSRLARAAALAHLGDLDEARAEIERALRSAESGQAVEAAVEAAEVETYFGDAQRAEAHLGRIEGRSDIDPNERSKLDLVRAALHGHSGNNDEATAALHRVAGMVMRTTPAFEVKRLLTQAMIARAAGDPGASAYARAARNLAHDQGARLWDKYGSILEAADDDTRLSDAIVLATSDAQAVSSMAADVLVPRLSGLSGEAVAALVGEAENRPWRWRSAIRRSIAALPPEGRLLAAGVLVRIGEWQDVELLRNTSRVARDRRLLELGRTLARRLAPRVLVDDLGRVQVRIGDRVVDGGSVRRRVLALLCLLLSRPKFACPREEVIDSLWPDLDPAAALNSLNQTVYFLRRVFEPEYRDDISPGYVHQDGETVWLDTELVDSRSRRCLALIRETPGTPSPEVAVRLATEYSGRFALDFAYDEWAAGFRDALHAGFLRTIEQAIRSDVDAGRWERGTYLAERAAEVDPESDEIQLALVRLYRMSGAFAAAAEAYAHYARSMKELGLEPTGSGDLMVD